MHRWTGKSGTPWHPDRLTPQIPYVAPSCGKSFREHRTVRSFPHWLLQLQLWLTTEPLCGMNTNSQKLALLWEFYGLMEKNRRKGILMFLFYRGTRRFEMTPSTHSSAYLGAWFPCKCLRIRYFACEQQQTHPETQEGSTLSIRGRQTASLFYLPSCQHCFLKAVVARVNPLKSVAVNRAPQKWALSRDLITKGPTEEATGSIWSPASCCLQTQANPVNAEKAVKIVFSRGSLNLGFCCSLTVQNLQQPCSY